MSGEFLSVRAKAAVCFGIVKEALVCVLLASLCAVVISAVVLIQKMPGMLHSEAEATRTMASGQISAALADTNGRVQDALKIVDARLTAATSSVDTAVRATDARTGQALALVSQLGPGIQKFANDSQDQLTNLNKAVAATLEPVARTAEQVNKELPAFLDCQYDYDTDGSVTFVGNRSCVEQRYNDLSASLDRTLSAVALAAPAMAVDAHKIADSSVGIAASTDATGKEIAIAAENFNKPQTKFQQFKLWLITIARVYGAI